MTKPEPMPKYEPPKIKAKDDKTKPDKTKDEAIPELDPKQHRAIVLLLGGNSIADVADKVSISRTTIYRWLKEQPFKDELQRGREAIIEEAVVTLAAETVNSIRVMIEIRDDPTVNAAIRLQAARSVYGDALRLMETKVFGERIQRIEEMLEEMKGSL